MLEEVSTVASSTAASATMLECLIYAAVSGILGFIISLSYLKTGKVSKNFARTLVILPILVCVVMLVVNGNLGTSVAIMGAFGLIRFRSLQGSSRDIGYIFFAMTIGLTCSMGQCWFAVIITVCVIVVMLALKYTNYAQEKQVRKDLRITIPEHLDYTEIFDDLLENYTNEHQLVQVKTTNMGSLYEIEYQIRLKEEKKEKEFLDAIRCRNGNLTVICGRMDFAEEGL